jgi:hypothetical protein
MRISSLFKSASAGAFATILLLSAPALANIGPPATSQNLSTSVGTIVQLFAGDSYTIAADFTNTFGDVFKFDASNGISTIQVLSGGGFPHSNLTLSKSFVATSPGAWDIFYVNTKSLPGSSVVFNSTPTITGSFAGPSVPAPGPIAGAGLGAIAMLALLLAINRRNSISTRGW